MDISLLYVRTFDCCKKFFFGIEGKVWEKIICCTWLHPINISISGYISKDVPFFPGPWKERFSSANKPVCEVIVQIHTFNSPRSKRSSLVEIKVLFLPITLIAPNLSHNLSKERHTNKPLMRPGIYNTKPERIHIEDDYNSIKTYLKKKIREALEVRSDKTKPD